MYLSPTALAKRWSVSLSTVERRIREGTIPVMRVGPRAVRIALADIERIERPGPYVAPERLADLDAMRAKLAEMLVDETRLIGTRTYNDDEDREKSKDRALVAKSLKSMSKLLAAYGRNVAEGVYEDEDRAALAAR